jgi:predicted phosphodiesterase
LTRRFDKKKYEFLKGIIEKADRIIINGDFWDGYGTTFDKFINSKWSQLFPLLKSKNAIYIFGNHDKQEFSDERVNLFSVQQTDRYFMKKGKWTLRIEHGHLIEPSLEGRFPKLFDHRLAVRLGSLSEATGVKIFKANFLKIYEKQAVHIKEWIKNNLDSETILIAGHVHVGEYDRVARYINTGYIRHGFAQYVEIEDNEIKLVNTKY